MNNAKLIAVAFSVVFLTGCMGGSNLKDDPTMGGVSITYSDGIDAPSIKYSHGMNHPKLTDVGKNRYKINKSWKGDNKRIYWKNGPVENWIEYWPNGNIKTKCDNAFKKRVPLRPFGMGYQHFCGAETNWYESGEIKHQSKQYSKPPRTVRMTGYDRVLHTYEPVQERIYWRKNGLKKWSIEFTNDWYIKRNRNKTYTNGKKRNRWLTVKSWDENGESEVRTYINWLRPNSALRSIINDDISEFYGRWRKLPSAGGGGWWSFPVTYSQYKNWMDAGMVFKITDKKHDRINF